MNSTWVSPFANELRDQISSFTDLPTLKGRKGAEAAELQRLLKNAIVTLRLRALELKQLAESGEPRRPCSIPRSCASRESLGSQRARKNAIETQYQRERTRIRMAAVAKKQDRFLRLGDSGADGALVVHVCILRRKMHTRQHRLWPLHNPPLARVRMARAGPRGADRRSRDATRRAGAR